MAWTSTWQLVWKVRGTPRCRMVLPEVRYWKLVESYGLQTLCECHERRCGCSADLGTGENRCPPKKTAKHIEAKQKLNQQRIQTSRVRECKTGGVAREPQSAKRNFESGLRGDQDSPRRPAERRGIVGQKQEPLHVSGKHRRNSNPRATRTGFLEGIGFEEAGWVDTGRFSRGNRWLDDGSPETQQRSGSKEEKTPRGGRERIWERCQNGRRLHGWSGWFSVVVRVQTRILQAISERKRPVEGKEFWSVGGLHGHFPVATLDAHRLGRVDVARMFQKTGWSERWYSRTVHIARSLGEDCDARQSSSIRDGADKQNLMVERAGELQSSWMDI